MRPDKGRGRKGDCWMGCFPVQCGMLASGKPFDYGALELLALKQTTQVAADAMKLMRMGEGGWSGGVYGCWTGSFALQCGMLATGGDSTTPPMHLSCTGADATSRAACRCLKLRC